jgi:hypothetical protein
MAKTTTFSNDLVALIFNATAIANIADNAASSPITILYVSLHTSSPGVGGNQTTNETAYTNYARVAVNRNSGGWTVASGSAANTALIQFPTCGASGSTVTHVGIGTASSGTGKLLYSGALSASLGVSTNIQPQFSASALTTTES